MILPEILDFSLLVDEFALLVLQLLLGDDPVVVDSLPLLLEVRQQLLLLLVGLLQLPQFLPHRQLHRNNPTLNSSDSVSFTFIASFTPCCSRPRLADGHVRGRGLGWGVAVLGASNSVSYISEHQNIKLSVPVSSALLLGRGLYLLLSLSA